MAKIKKKHSNTNTGQIVLAAIKKLMKNTGWTARTIVKFIKMEYGITDQNVSKRVSRALKRGVKLGLLQNERGRYRLNDMSRLARTVVTSDIRTRLNQMHRERPLRMRSRSLSSAKRTRRRKTKAM